jgi:predicted O-methyltransferase YrrM
MTFSQISQWIADHSTVLSSTREQENSWWYELVYYLGFPETHRPHFILEIGSYLCASTNVLAAAAQERDYLLVAVDAVLNHQPISIYEQKTLIHSDLTSYVHFELGRSEAVLPEVVKEYGKETFAFALIDGDHDYPPVYNDFLLVDQLLAPYGVVAFHDAHFPGVAASLKLLHNQGKLDGYVKLRTPYSLQTKLPRTIPGFFDDSRDREWSVVAYRKTP